MVSRKRIIVGNVNISYKKGKLRLTDKDGVLFGLDKKLDILTLSKVGKTLKHEVTGKIFRPKQYRDILLCI